MGKPQTRKVYSYARVSTDYQFTENQSIAIDRYASEHKEERIVNLEEVISGRKMTGDSLKWLLQEVQEDKVSKIIVWDLDRLGRNLVQACLFVNECIKHDTSILFLNQPTLDITTAAGRLVFNLLMSVAQHEAEKVGPRTRAGLDRAAHTCRNCGHLDMKAERGINFKCGKCGHQGANFHGGTPGKKWMRASTAKKVDEVLRLSDAGFKSWRIHEMTGLDQRTVLRIIKDRDELPGVRERVWDK